MAENNLPCGFARWKSRNPNGTLEEYQEVLKNFNSTKSIPSFPKGRWLPGGVFISTEGVTPSEIAIITREFSQQASGQQ